MNYRELKVLTVFVIILNLIVSGTAIALATKSNAGPIMLAGLMFGICWNQLELNWAEFNKLKKLLVESNTALKKAEVTITNTIHALNDNTVPEIDRPRIQVKLKDLTQQYLESEERYNYLAEQINQPKYHRNINLP